jgi:hypothetical protein
MEGNAPMDDSLGVQIAESHGGSSEEGQSLVPSERGRRREQSAKTSMRDVLHDQQQFAVCNAETDETYDVGVVESAQHRCLLTHLQKCLVGEPPLEEPLDGHRQLEVILALVAFVHASQHFAEVALSDFLAQREPSAVDDPRAPIGRAYRLAFHRK